MKKSLGLILISAALSSCATNQLYINVTQPAPVTISPSVKKVAVIDRSTPTDQTKITDAIEKVLTLEDSNLDSIGSGEAIRGLKEELSLNDRFESVTFLENDKFRTSYTGQMPAPLSWDQVDIICRENGCDALFALELYDTDTKVNYSSQSAQINTPLGTVPGIEHIVTMETLVKTGWRIYSPSDRSYPDEYIIPESISSTGRGINPLKAASALLNRKEYVKQVSSKAGRVYAIRLLPYRLQVTRDYYVKGTDNFKIAKRMAQLGKWDDAAVLWEKETSSSNSKVAGRAHFNMAIISEINGELETALSWAQKSYEIYGIKPALDYARILENRMSSNDLLMYQEQR